MDDFKVSMSYDSGWKYVRAEKPIHQNPVAARTPDRREDLPPIVIQQETAAPQELPDPRPTVQDMQVEILNKLKEIQLELQAIKTMIREVQAAEPERDVIRPDANKPSRFFK
jgi:hypothetical protein